MTLNYSDDREEPLILHCFADHGVESEALACYGNVVRVGINARDTNESEPIKADAYDLPISEDVSFDLGVFHPICKKWAHLTSLSGDPDDHPDQIPRARWLGKRYCRHYAIENKPEAPLRDPVILHGRMFGLPIAFERGFETSFHVTQPPRHKRFGTDGERVETSPFFFSERSHGWWGSVKGYHAKRYPKEHLAKNCIPAPYIHHICRGWLRVYEDETGESQGRPDYSDYNARMEIGRRYKQNRSIYNYVEGRAEPDNELESLIEEEEELASDPTEGGQLIPPGWRFSG